MWVPFDTFGEIQGRVRGVALPFPNGQVLVWTDRGLFSLWYFRSAFVNRLAAPGAADGAFDPATGTLTWNGTAYPVLGGAAPANDVRAHTRHPGGDRVAVDPDDGSVHVLDAAGAVRQVVARAPAGERPLAAFSADGRALIVAGATSVRAFRYEPAPGRERPRWAAVAGADDQARVLGAVRGAPDEDTPRLVYADWLDEHDDPTRAEFIRLQCRLAARERDEPVPASDPDQQRELQLRAQLGDRWLAELPVVRGVTWAGFRRGFPGVSAPGPAALVRAAARVWAAAPVELVTTSGLNRTGAQALAGSDAFGRVRVLNLEGFDVRAAGEEPLRTLFDSPRASGLERLSLSVEVGEAGIGTLARSPHLTGLVWLAIGSGVLTDAAADALIAAPGLKNLRGGSFVSHRLSGAARNRLKARFPNATV